MNVFQEGGVTYEGALQGIKTAKAELNVLLTAHQIHREMMPKPWKETTKAGE